MRTPRYGTRGRCAYGTWRRSQDSPISSQSASAQAQAPPDPSYDSYWESGQSAAPGDGAYVGLNGAQAIKTSFLPSGPRVTPQGSGTWAWEITSAGYGRTGSVQPLESAIQEVTGNRVDYVRAGGPAEWYVNTPGGIEGWLRVTSEPVG